ncbi:hypothetical protein TNCV_3609981 [Trichonephila clavipes]|nr:hypothetical protein TNCV_3609981 [Trichonephila clavipes]
MKLPGELRMKLPGELYMKLPGELRMKLNVELRMKLPGELYMKLTEESHEVTNLLEIRLTRHELLRTNNRTPFENPEDHQKTAFQKIPHKSSAASCKSPWQSFCLPGLGLGIQAILHQGNSPNWWHRARNQIFQPTRLQKPDYWFPHVDFSFAILLYVPFFDKCSLQLINTPLPSYEFLLLAFVPWLFDGIDEYHTTKKVYNAQPIDPRRKGRPNLRWIYILEKDLIVMRIKNWRTLAGRRLRPGKGLLGRPRLKPTTIQHDYSLGRMAAVGGVGLCAESDEENKMKKAASVPVSSEMRNTRKSKHCYLGVQSTGEMNIKMDVNEKFVDSLTLK